TADDFPNRDIFLVDVASGSETQITQRQNACPVGWAPDGQRMLFALGRGSATDLWMIRAKNSKPVGEPQLVRANFHSGELSGITRDGALFYGTASGGSEPGGIGELHIYTGEIDVEQGTATASPLASEKFSVRDDFQVATWSPDGEHLAYKAVREGVQ